MNMKAIERTIQKQEKNIQNKEKEKYELEEKQSKESNISVRKKMVEKLKALFIEINALKKEKGTMEGIKKILNEKIDDLKKLNERITNVMSKAQKLINQQQQKSTSTTSKSSWWSSIPSFLPKQTTTTSTVKNAVRNNLTRRANENRKKLANAEQLVKQVNNSFPTNDPNITEHTVQNLLNAIPNTGPMPSVEELIRTVKEKKQKENKQVMNYVAKLQQQQQPDVTYESLKARLNALKRGGKSRRNRSKRNLTRRRR